MEDYFPASTMQPTTATTGGKLRIDVTTTRQTAMMSGFGLVSEWLSNR